MPNHVEQIEAGCSSGRLQICACASTKMHHLQLVIHHDAGGRVAAEHDLVGRALHFGRRLWSTRVFRRQQRERVRFPGCGEVEEVGATRRFLSSVDTKRLVERGEHGGRGTDGLGVPEHQNAAGFQRVVKEREILSCKLGCK